MALTVYHEGMCSKSVVKETENGIRYEKIEANTGNGLEIGDIGVGGQLDDGSYLVNGVFTGGSDTSPDSWNIIFGS
ncbi:hypothetical protein [Aquimarina sp. AU119]|uniref:hypothetical protein n=1 Tax=Aquimarina sp. AU119 TaxID=2108528 RepID=UPI000D686611|nr:hypothetical protein [Aquimarina sp. AU119]